MLELMFQFDEIIYLVVLSLVFANGLYINYKGKTENKLTMVYISYFIFFISAIMVLYWILAFFNILAGLL